MCVAYPGTVITVRRDEGKARVDFSGTQVDALTAGMDVAEGDRVLVHAGCVIQVLTQSDAEALDEIFSELAAMGEMP